VQLSREIEDQVRTLVARVWLAGCDAVGRGPLLTGRPFVSNLGRIEIGAAFELSSTPVQSHLISARGGVLRIGDRVRMAHGVSISAHAGVTIGDDSQIGPMVIIMDVDFHDLRDRDALGAPRPIQIGRHVVLGAGVIVLRGARIGDGARIEPNSVVNRLIPPGAKARGNPARPVLEPA
jgi:acetyltransferase-like isoleucine patch superfamily enzyme